MFPAEIVALQTLREHCSPEQAAALDAHEPLVVTGPSGMLYRLWVHPDCARVEWSAWKADVRARTLPALPPGDLALLAKLLIENDEGHWLMAGRCCGVVWVL